MASSTRCTRWSMIWSSHLLDEDVLFMHADIGESNALTGGDDQTDRKELLKR